MHELAITQSIFDLVLDRAKAAGAEKIAAINLVIGQMTGINPDSLRLYLGFLSNGTIAQGAQLNVKTALAQGNCRNCNNAFAIEEFDRRCPSCGDACCEITGGRELFLESIEVE